jgi:hypothetical protein
MAQSLQSLTMGFCVDQIGEAFNLSEVEPAVVEGPAGKRTGFRHCASGKTAEGIKNASHHGDPAVQM